VLAARVDGDTQGIAPGADVIAIDVSDRDDPHNPDYGKFAPAIDMLAYELGVDLINISGGAFMHADVVGNHEHTTQIAQAIADARCRGTTIVAAVGNEDRDGAAIPAQLAGVVGVGSIGVSSVAPPGSLMEHMLGKAQNCGLMGRFGELEAFCVIDTAYGNGLDAVAPGIGVFVEDDLGILQEFEGTSFAAPIVTGVLACALGGDLEYRDKRGLERAVYAEELLQSLCKPLGLPVERQGWGMPVLALHSVDENV